MEIIALAAFIALALGWAWLRGQMAKGLNRTVFERSKHQQGQRLLQDTFVLSVPGTPKGAVIDAIIEELKVYDEAAFMARAYATRHDDSSVAIAHGSTMLTNWRLVVIADEGQNGEVDVFVSAVEATEMDGVVQGVRELELVHERIRSAVARLQHRSPEPR